MLLWNDMNCICLCISRLVRGTRGELSNLSCIEVPYIDTFLCSFDCSTMFRDCLKEAMPYAWGNKKQHIVIRKKTNFPVTSGLHASIIPWAQLINNEHSDMGCTIPVRSIDFQGIHKKIEYILKSKACTVFLVLCQMCITSNLIAIYWVLASKVDGAKKELLCGNRTDFYLFIYLALPCYPFQTFSWA